LAGNIFIISAPSGSGKSTLVNQLRSMVANLEFSVSYTTRTPRGSEQDGREYCFTTREGFEQMVAEDAFLEHANVFGNYYGTARSSVEHACAMGRDLILDIDIQGAEQVMQRVPEAVSIFILPPSPAVLEKRLRNRSASEGDVSEAVIERRLAKARLELERLWEYRYALVNDVLEDAVAELQAIVLAERGEGTAEEVKLAQSCRTSRPSQRLKRSLESFGIQLAGAPRAD
jgi:guanylate kinase